MYSTWCSKINVATATFQNVITAVNTAVLNNPYSDYFTYHRMIEAAYENVKIHMQIFGSENRVKEKLSSVIVRRNSECSELKK